MSGVRELFTVSVDRLDADWGKIVREQFCEYYHKKCFKCRKSEPDISIGVCSVRHGRDKDVVICPYRLLENRQIFTDCISLLSNHEIGNELHIVPEVTIPGGSVDYFLVSSDSDRKVKDFMGIELQAMDTTGDVWTQRQKALKELGLIDEDVANKPYGINWKMTAKTILLQLHHKVKTFEGLNKHLVLVVQDCLLDYIKREFRFDHISDKARLGDAMHFHVYQLKRDNDDYKLTFSAAYSTDTNGVSGLLGLNADANISYDALVEQLEGKISNKTLYMI